MNCFLDELSNTDTRLNNEIFRDLYVNSNKFKSSSHMSVAFSLVYLYTVMYRGCIYGRTTEDVTIKGVADMLGLNSSNYSYLYKRNGLLDEIGYTKTTDNPPISFEYKDKELSFNYRKDTEGLQYAKGGSRKYCKVPVKAFYKSVGDMLSDNLNGYFYIRENTFYVNYKDFHDMLSVHKKELGFKGFHIYCYLLMNIYQNKGIKSVSRATLSKIVGVTERSITSYTNALRDLGYLDKSLVTRRINKNNVFNRNVYQK